MSKELINAMCDVTNSRNHSELCRILEIQAPTISKIYNGNLYPGPVILIRMHEVSGISISRLKELRGPKAPK